MPRWRKIHGIFATHDHPNYSWTELRTRDLGLSLPVSGQNTRKVFSPFGIWTVWSQCDSGDRIARPIKHRNGNQRVPGSNSGTCMIVHFSHPVPFSLLLLLYLILLIYLFIYLFVVIHVILIISEKQFHLHYENTPIQIYRKFHLQKPKFFQVKNSDIFHISVQNIDCGYSLEPPRRGGSNEYPQSMFWAKKKNNVYPCKPQFHYIKWGLRGSKLYRHVFVMI